MKLLFTLDSKNYNDSIETVCRPSSRGIIIRDGKIGMIHSKKFDYYKFPGGGIDDGESIKDAMIREVREEAGLIVIPESVEEFGNVHRRSVTENGGLFLQDNYYFICKCEEQIASQVLDEYEAKEGFTLEFVDPHFAIEKNRACTAKSKNPNMLEREARVLEMLINGGYLA
jgi:8-oxo-dGTP pyrophosphatase MutT (NUDIX family)